MTQWWLARDEAVYGPYQIEQLQHMLSKGELAENDQFCPVGTESWVTFAIFAKEQSAVPTPAASSPSGGDTKKKTKAKPPLTPQPQKASTAQKDFMRSLGVAITPGMTMAEARTAISSAVDGGTRERLDNSRRKEQRLNCAMRAVNGDGSYDRGYGHPLKYVKKELIQQIIDWLDALNPCWDADAWNFETDPFKVLDDWLVPAIAHLYPDLIKDTYRGDFGPGRKWRLLR